MEVTMSKEFSNRLYNAMNFRNIKATELAELSDIPKSAISQYLSGKFEPKQKGIMQLAKALNISEAWLMGADVPMQRLYESATNTIPLLNKYEKSIQYSIDNHYNNSIPYLEFINSPEEYFALKISEDNSMAPLLDINDIAIIHLQSEYEDRQTCLIELDGKVLIRKIYILENTLELHAMNPYYPIIIINKNEFKERNFKVIGSIVKAENQSAFQ